ncbi:MAG: N-acetylmuramoyl-L-alanine amidase, partial [Rickettsiales bacterium]
KESNKYKSNKPPLIVIDAGHGGVDPGTIGKNGTKEKDLVLGYAKELRNKLLKLKKYRVVLTRSDDEFIMLRGRVAIARREKASLFISIHADSAENSSARGLSVYTVSEKASDKEAETLAARENKSDIIGGMDLSTERADVADILISLAQRETKNNSATFADFLVVNLRKRVNMLPNSHRFAGFAVLKAPDIPSVLIEVGFLSHPDEEREVKSKHYRNKVVDGIADGIDAYFLRKSSFGMAEL